MSADDERKKAEELTREIGALLKGVTPSHCSFLFMLASHGEDGWMTYASSIARGDAVKMLRELATKLETMTTQ